MKKKIETPGLVPTFSGKVHPHRVCCSSEALIALPCDQVMADGFEEKMSLAMAIQKRIIDTERRPLYDPNHEQVAR